MFIKKKQPLPARPSIPAREEILADLRESGDDDIVFKPLTKVLKEEESLLNEETSADFKSKEVSSENISLITKLDTAKAYEMAKSFLDKCDSLEMALLDIEEKKASLSATKLTLEDDIKNVKESLGEKLRSQTPIMID